MPKHTTQTDSEDQWPLPRMSGTLAAVLLAALAERWPAPRTVRKRAATHDPGSRESSVAYARGQFERKVRSGLAPFAKQVDLIGADILEIGSGHGGISCYLACVGARRVVSIDVDTSRLEFGEALAEQIAALSDPPRPLPLEFMEMDCHDLKLENESFDVVVADNILEHVDDPAVVLAECYRVLRPGGQVLIPSFSSIFSKFGLHLKHGLKLPWANVFFTEPTIVAALQRRAAKHPELLEWYPGLSRNPRSVRDVRAHRDLNNLTYEGFRRAAETVGFNVRLRVKPTGGARVLRHVPGYGRSLARDVMSRGAEAVLVKP